MMLWQQLRLPVGITCFTGSGGKTTLAHCLARQLPGRVIFCTTTRIFPSAQMPVLCEAEAAELQSALVRHHAVCIGTPTEEGKLAAPKLPFECLKSLADYILVEADGSRGRPMKAHRDCEPVIPDGTARRIRLLGASGFGCVIREAAHCPSLFAELAGSPEEALITPELAAAVLRREGGFDTLVINQIETAEQMRQAETVARLMAVPVYGGQVRDGVLKRLR